MLQKQTLMRQYIEESPQETEKYLNSPLDDDSVQLVRDLSNGQSLVLTGCGTSYHLALLGARYFQSIAHIDARAIPSFDLAWYQPEVTEGKILIAISQSGASKATRDAMAQAKKYCTKIIGITASEETPMAKESDLHLILPGGWEKALPKTRVFTTGAVQLLRLAYETRKINDGLVASPFPEPSDLRRKMDLTLQQNLTIIDRIAEDWNNYEMFSFVGGGPAWIVACEGALKMRENNYTFADGYEVEEFAHGRTCSFQKDRPLITIALRGPSVNRIWDILANARYLHVPTLAVVEEGIDPLLDADYLIKIPSMPSEFTAAILAAMPLQLFSHQFTLMRNIDPDAIRLDQPEFEFAHHKWIFPPGTH